MLDKILRTTSALALASAALTLGASAQGLLSVGPSGSVTGFTGPSVAPCNYPFGPLNSFVGYNSSWYCPEMNTIPAAPSTIGDIASNRLANTYWVTDGTMVGEFDGSGFIERIFQVTPGQFVAGQITGMGYDSAADVLWITDGATAAGIQPPVAPAFPTCPGPGVIQIGPIPLSPTPGSTVTDIATAASPCALTNDLQGLAIDTAAQTSGVMYVTDGSTVYYLEAPGTPASPTFYRPVPCGGMPTVNLGGGFMLQTESRGLAFVASPNAYGSVTGPFGLPVIGLNNQTYIPNPTLECTVAGFNPGDVIVVLGLAFSFLCPELDLGGDTYLHMLPPAYNLGVQLVDQDSLAPVTFPLPLIINDPLGANVHLQAFVLDGSLNLTRTTRGLSFTTARP
jgi:hypothetical protein